MKKAVVFFCIVAAALMVLCSKKSNPTGPGGDQNTIETVYYTVSGNTIIITTPAQTYTGTYCDGDSLVSESYTDTAQTHTVPFLLLNNDNLLIMSSGTSGDSLIRVGTGTGIQGQWTGSDGISYQIGPNTVTVVINQAASFIGDWNSFQASQYNITVAEISSNSVTLTGNSSKEVVTITWNSAGDEIYSSSKSTNAPSTVKANPTTCPNDSPAWYDQFLSANSNYIYAKVASVPSAAHSFSSLFVKKLAHHF